MKSRPQQLVILIIVWTLAFSGLGLVYFKSEIYLEVVFFYSMMLLFNFFSPLKKLNEKKKLTKLNFTLLYQYIFI